MRSVTLYTRSFCIWCIRAKWLLRREGIAYQEIDASDAGTRQALFERTGRRTVPQVFFGEENIGGFDDLRALAERGELDLRLGRASA